MERTWLHECVWLGVALLLSALAATGILASCGCDLRTVAIGGRHLDLPAHFWTLWWARQPAEPVLANYPVGGVDLYILEPVNLWLMRLFAPLMGEVAAHNLTAWLALAVAGLGGYALGRQVSGRPAGGLVALVFCITCPSLWAALSDGTGEFTWLGLVPLTLAAFAWLDDGRWRRVPVAGGALALTAWACWYYGMAAGMGGLLLVFWRCRKSGWWGRGLRAWVAVGLAVLLVAPAILRFQRSDLEPPRQTSETLMEQLWGGSPGPEPDAEFAQLPIRERLGAGCRVGSSRVGWILALLLLVTTGAARLPRSWWPWFGIAAPALILALGSATPDGLHLPFLYLNRLLVWLGRPIHQPFHFLALVFAVLAGAAALIVGGPRPRRWPGALWLAGLLLIADLLVPFSSGLPLPTSALPRPAPLLALAAEADRGAVLELPGVLEDNQEQLDQEALHQLVHRHPIPRFPVFPTSTLRDEGICRVRESELVAAVRTGRTRGHIDVQDLRAAGYGWVILDEEDGPHLTPLLDTWLGEARWSGDGLRVYSLEGTRDPARPGSGETRIRPIRKRR